jgi:hypothetical protein
MTDSDSESGKTNNPTSNNSHQIVQAEPEIVKNVVTRTIKMPYKPNESIYSDTVEAFGLNWRILLKPHDRNNNYIAFFLDCESVDELPDLEKTFKCRIRFLSSDTDCRDYDYHYSFKHKFTLRERDIGRWNLLEKECLENTGEDSYGYVIDGMLTIVIELEVLDFSYYFFLKF